MPPLIEWVVQLKTLFRLWMTDCKRPAITKLAPPELPEPAREPPGVRRLLPVEPLPAELGVCSPLPLLAEPGVGRPLGSAEVGVLISALLTPICF